MEGSPRANPLCPPTPFLRRLFQDFRNFWCLWSNPARNNVHPHPPSPQVFAKRHFSGEGGGVYILSPHAAGILYPPPFYTAPTPRRVFSGVGGWGCIKFWPRIWFKGGIIACSRMVPTLAEPWSWTMVCTPSEPWSWKSPPWHRAIENNIEVIAEGGFQDHGSEGVQTMVQDHGSARVGTIQVQAIMPPLMWA